MDKLDAEWVTHDRAHQIALWVEAVELGLRLRANPEFEGRVLLLRYEELKADPETQIQRLFDFADLSAPSSAVAKVAALTDFSNVNAPTGEGQFYRRGHAGDWVNHFTPSDSALFAEVVGDLFVRAGYAY